MIPIPTNKIKLQPLLCLIMLIAFGHNVAAQKKTALIIAIGEYQQLTSQKNWSPTSSLNDLRHIKESLLLQGFKAENILVLKNEAATRENILHTLNNKLPNISSIGGSTIVHFSGHGQRIFDDNNEEADGLDESIVPYDAAMHYIAGKYEGQRHIRDDELNEALIPLREKLGHDGEVLVMLDACHSGTGLRAGSSAWVRGSETIMAPKAYLERNQEKIHLEEASSLFNDQPNLAKVIGFYAAAPYQLNYECRDDQGERIGSLSYAFALAFSKLKTHDSYETLFARIRQIMANKSPEQTPQAEGPLNLAVLGGVRLNYQPCFKIREIQGDRIKLQGGLLQGLADGTTVHFFHELMPTKIIAKGIVEGSHLPYSIVKITEGETSQIQGADCRATIANRQYVYTLDMNFDVNIPRSDMEYLQAKVTENKAFKVNYQTPDITIYLSPDSKNKLNALTPNGVLLVSANNAVDLWTGLRKYYIANFLRQLESETPALKAKLELVGHNDELLQDLAGNYFLRKGQRFKLRVSNQGTERLYYTVIGIDAAQDINTLAPYYAAASQDYEFLTPADLFLEPGQSAIYNYPYDASEPLGLDVLKIVTSREAIDLKLATRGTSTGNPSPFAVLYQELMEAETRGEVAYRLPEGEVGVWGIFLLVSQ